MVAPFTPTPLTTEQKNLLAGSAGKPEALDAQNPESNAAKAFNKAVAQGDIVPVEKAWGTEASWEPEKETASKANTLTVSSINDKGEKVTQTYEIKNREIVAQAEAMIKKNAEAAAAAAASAKEKKELTASLKNTDNTTALQTLVRLTEKPGNSNVVKISKMTDPSVAIISTAASLNWIKEDKELTKQLADPKAADELKKRKDVIIVEQPGPEGKATKSAYVVANQEVQDAIETERQKLAKAAAPAVGSPSKEGGLAGLINALATAFGFGGTSAAAGTKPDGTAYSPKPGTGYGAAAGGANAAYGAYSSLNLKMDASAVSTLKSFGQKHAMNRADFKRGKGNQPADTLAVIDFLQQAASPEGKEQLAELKRTDPNAYKALSAQLSETGKMLQTAFKNIDGQNTHYTQLTAGINAQLASNLNELNDKPAVRTTSADGKEAGKKPEKEVAAVKFTNKDLEELKKIGKSMLEQNGGMAVIQNVVTAAVGTQTVGAKPAGTDVQLPG